ncbi:GNAT family N-acetyltransferase [Cohnella caldifontis]|uniref:GNAT family N-acetyltransferase n=1 Tax=Cohnella caldifontis TaxID=3027471 RepID=UPI0023EC5DB4|nr:GNAT family N-acetyltransferase [Cohnella sp. YIM B05605]
MRNFEIRRLRDPDDYEAAANLLNFVGSEPTTGERLKEVEDQIPPGRLHYDEEGRLMGWDRPKWVAEDEKGQVVGYAIAWRAPWTAPGELVHTVVIHPDRRGDGIGGALYGAVYQWLSEDAQ